MVGIQLDRYDRSRELTIDPFITYSTLMGGGATETMATIKINGNCSTCWAPRPPATGRSRPRI